MIVLFILGAEAPVAASFVLFWPPFWRPVFHCPQLLEISGQSIAKRHKEQWIINEKNHLLKISHPQLDRVKKIICMWLRHQKWGFQSSKWTGNSETLPVKTQLGTRSCAWACIVSLLMYLTEETCWVVGSGEQHWLLRFVEWCKV